MKTDLRTYWVVQLANIEAADFGEWPTNMGSERAKYDFQKALLIKI